MAISLCFCIDENYVEQLAAVVRSLVETNKSNELVIYVISNGVTDKSKLKLSGIIKKIDGFTIEFIESQDKRVSELKAGGHISSATYIRFEIPELLQDVDKVIYLDADLIVEDDLRDFWNVDVSKSYVAAVTNPLFDRYDALGMDKSWGYFNAGILLINTKKWKENKVKEKALSYLKANKENAIMFDQDALNYVFSGDWVRLPIKWNIQTVFLRNYSKLNSEDMLAVKEAVGDQGIIHYSSSSKPWDFLDAHPLRKKFLIYYDGKINHKFSLLRTVLKYTYNKFLFYMSSGYLK